MLNYSGLSSLTPAEVAASAARMLRFFDLGGHERYSKTLLHGLTAMLPDYVLLCVSAVAGGWRFWFAAPLFAASVCSLSNCGTSCGQRCMLCRAVLWRG